MTQSLRVLHVHQGLASYRRERCDLRLTPPTCERGASLCMTYPSPSISGGHLALIIDDMFLNEGSGDSFIPKWCFEG